MASTPSYVDAGRLRADTCGPGVLNRLFEGQRYMLVRYSDHSPRAISVTCAVRDVAGGPALDRPSIQTNRSVVQACVDSPARRCV